MEDIITDMRNSLASSINAARFNDAMSAQDALIESQGLTTRSAIDAQTSIMQSEAAENRLNQTLNNPYVYQSLGVKPGKFATILGWLGVATWAICLIVITVVLTR